VDSACTCTHVFFKLYYKSFVHILKCGLSPYHCHRILGTMYAICGTYGILLRSDSNLVTYMWQLTKVSFQEPVIRPCPRPSKQQIILEQIRTKVSLFFCSKHIILSTSLSEKSFTNR
jgi:hypothetical protein